MSKDIAISVEHLTKKFGDFTADEDLSFQVERDEIFGILGPNGAGKSTLIRMLTTLLVPTSGRALVMGHDVAKDTSRVRHEIGVIPQANTVDGDLTAWESLDLYGRFYEMAKKDRRERSTELLQAVGLWEWRDKAAGTYSGGMRRRLEIARGLIHRPRVFFLDEPTTGLDPQSRRVIWELLEKLRGEGDLTILICTHYMDEADRLCDRLAIVDHGKIAALGTPRELKASFRAQLLEIDVEPLMPALVRLRDTPEVLGVALRSGSLRLYASEAEELIRRWRENWPFPDIRLLGERWVQPDMEDVFTAYSQG